MQALAFYRMDFDMKKNRELADNVWEFLNDTAVRVGRMHAERFSQDVFVSCLDGLESPIEDLFLIALHAQCQAENIAVNPGPTICEHGKPSMQDGIYVRPQAVIGSFRVDFVLTQIGIGPDEILRPLAVELDGHAFHDKDKKQRAYEKARDRFLVKEGYRVLHFTGSEVVADPHKVAYEALDLLGVYSGSYRKFDPLNPLGVGE